MTGPVDSTKSSPPGAADFFTRFVRDVHVLIAEGFSRLDAASLHNEQEEHISGQIVRHTRRWLNDSNAPRWVEHYNVNAEDPEEGVLGADGLLKGKSRPRIDIRVESSERRPRPVFTFEAKRFYAGSSAAEYLGDEGLKTLLNGTKGRDDQAAGMLGYVQARPISAVSKLVRTRLRSDLASHGLDPSGEVWAEVSLDARIPATFVSRHARASGLTPLAVYHSFLPCCAAALPPSPSTP